MGNSHQIELGSFRDPNGFVFRHEGTLYRQINVGGGNEYRRLIDSGLYDELVEAGLLVRHEEVSLRLEAALPAFTVIRPEPIPFISYPYEWCFGQLKAAALLTLELQRRALNRGLILRDASAYNVQFVGSRPVFIDTLSFGAREDGQPWPAYRQFCQHFLAPLALIAARHPALGQLSKLHLDGVPLNVVRRLLPVSSRLKPGLLMHLFLHGRADAAARETPGRIARSPKMSSTALLALTDSLQRAVRGLSWEPPATLWSNYTDDCNYTAAARDAKRAIVGELLDEARAGDHLNTVWDMGANTGDYSRIAATKARHVVSFDLDPAVVERHYRACRARGDKSVLPLVQDFTNASSAIGWHHEERKSLLQRGPADVALALALVHHLALGSNVPLPAVVRFFHEACRQLVIEFVPKEDSQVRRMMAAREDIFPDYTRSGFEEAFSRDFRILRAVPLPDTVRTLYLMERR
jgi:hypothetical protein